ncbi:DHA2 family efflux MFS transporter permease subunit [Phyllobacterium lublinensis]|uniref:DHA2 family efflux MFS transporter permease subunit n=1 Tax=Phyllobacterium lublinensis TaxID=2875708 RepID=UPI001CCA7649|nr:DHA2 family efflux MFS transporter permease subunit [Phyllobacterium sp. 2063]
MNRIVPLVLAVALFMENMDSTVISTSLPAIAADIGSSPIALKLALTAYLVSLAVFIPISGWMADRFGAKNVFRAAIVVFILGSIACAASNSLLAFVVSRSLQGIGGAMMTPIARLVLVRSTPRNELVGAMAWLTMPALIGPLLGPPVGGFITTYFTWHWIFLINVPIGIVGIWIATRYLPAVETLIQRPLDVTGFFLSGIAASGVVFGLSVVSLPALPTWVGISTLAVGIVSTVLYLLHARRTAAPLLALDLFRNQVFRASIIGGSVFRIGVGALPFLLPLMFQIGFGLTPFQSGLITFVSALGAMSMKLVTTWFYQRTGFRNSLMYGSVLAAALIAVNGFFTPATPYWLMVLLLLAGGFFRSLFFTGINALTYADVPNEQTSLATPISSVAQQVSIALGVALAGGILEVSTTIHGGPLQLSDFHIAFFIVAAVSGLACLWFWGLKPDAGAEVSGHRPFEKAAAPAE